MPRHRRRRKVVAAAAADADPGPSALEIEFFGAPASAPQPIASETDQPDQDSAHQHDIYFRSSNPGVTASKSCSKLEIEFLGLVNDAGALVFRGLSFSLALSLAAKRLNLSRQGLFPEYPTPVPRTPVSQRIGGTAGIRPCATQGGPGRDLS